MRNVYRTIIGVFGFVALSSCADQTTTRQAAAITPFIVGGAPADPQKFRATVVVNGDCTGTVVGSQAILTAAHCVKPGGLASVKIGSSTVDATCTHHPDYKQSNCNTGTYPLACTPDVAMCKANNVVSGFPFEVVQTDRKKLSKGMPLTLVGYGCTAAGGSDFGTLFVGMGTVNELSTPTSMTPRQRFMIVGGPGYVCPGDSGAGQFDSLDTSSRFVVGVTSRGDSTTESDLVQMTDPSIVSFLTSWAKTNSSPICGVTAGAKGCR